MAVPHYAYLKLKMPGPKGVITIAGNLQKSDSCDREFSKISETFGVEEALDGSATSNNRMLMQERKKLAVARTFNETSDIRSHQTHPMDQSKTVDVSLGLPLA